MFGVKAVAAQLKYLELRIDNVNNKHHDLSRKYYNLLKELGMEEDVVLEHIVLKKVKK